MQISILLIMTAILVAFNSHAMAGGRSNERPDVEILAKVPVWFFTPRGVQKIMHSGDISYHAFGSYQHTKDGEIIALEPLTPEPQASQGGGAWKARREDRHLQTVSESLSESRLLVVSGSGIVRLELFGQHITQCYESVLTSPEDLAFTDEQTGFMTPRYVQVDLNEHLEGGSSNDYEQDKPDQHRPRVPLPRYHVGWPGPPTDSSRYGHEQDHAEYDYGH